MTFRPAAFAFHQRRDCPPPRAERLHETIGRGFADAEFAREIDNVADAPAVRPVPQKPTNSVCAAMRFNPLRVVDLVGVALVHEKIRRGKPER